MTRFSIVRELRSLGWWRWLREASDALPLAQMNTEERLVADYAGTGLTVGKHPMHYRRQELQARNVLSAVELRRCRDGQFVKAAGCVIARQRPGTAKGFIFISMEDETGIANVIVTPDLYERERLTVVRSKFLLVEGILQNQAGVIHVKATRLTALVDSAMEMRSHDFLLRVGSRVSPGLIVTRERPARVTPRFAVLYR